MPTTITVKKTATKKDLVVEVAKKYKISTGSRTTIELLVKILNEALKDDCQQDRAMGETFTNYNFHPSGGGHYLNTGDWAKIDETLLNIKQHIEFKKTKPELGNIHNVLVGCECISCRNRQ